MGVIINSSLRSSVDTDQYLSDVLPTREFAQEKTNVLRKIANTYRTHSTAIKVGLVFSLAIGSYLLRPYRSQNHFYTIFQGAQLGSLLH